MVTVHVAPFTQLWRVTVSLVKLKGSPADALGISVEQSCAYAVQRSKSPPFSRYPNRALILLAKGTPE